MIEEILIIAIIDPSFEEAYSKKGCPPRFLGLEVNKLKEIIYKYLPIL